MIKILKLYDLNSGHGEMMIHVANADADSGIVMSTTETNLKLQDVHLFGLRFMNRGNSTNI